MKTELILDVSGLTDVGHVRDHNEDCYTIEKNIFVVADGMGGAEGGEIASKLAVETVLNYFHEKVKTNQAGQENYSPDEIKEAIQKANDKIINVSSNDRSLNGMGCTVVVASWQLPETLHIANVGDARAYLFRDGRIKCLTEDHSVVGELVRKGELSWDEARVHRLRNVITQAVGIGLVMSPYQTMIHLKPQDKILLCSDGLWDMISDNDLQQIISQAKNPENLCRQLIDSANQAGGKDNTTVIAISVDGKERMGAE